MPRPRAVVIMGVSGSGKSTVGRSVAERLGWNFSDADDHHPPNNVARMSAGEPLTDDDRAPWLRILRDVIASSFDRGESIVLACSALKTNFRVELLAGNDAKLIYLKGEQDLIEARMRTRRDHFMSPHMLESQFEALEEPDVAFVVDVAQDVDRIVDAIVEELGSGADT